MSPRPDGSPHMELTVYTLVENTPGYLPDGEPQFVLGLDLEPVERWVVLDAHGFVPAASRMAARLTAREFTVTQSLNGAADILGRYRHELDPASVGTPLPGDALVCVTAALDAHQAAGQALFDELGNVTLTDYERADLMVAAGYDPDAYGLATR